MAYTENATDFAKADRAVTAADRDLRRAVQLISEEARPRLAQLGMAAVAVGILGALVAGRGRRSASRVSRAIDYSVLLPLAASAVPRIVSYFSSPRARAAGPRAVYPASRPIDTRRQGR